MNFLLNRKFYSIVRDLHLFLGLFLSPFVLVFGVSVFFLVHSWLPLLENRTSTRVISGLVLPQDLNKLSGRPLIEALKPLLARAGVQGEIGFVRHLVKEEKLVMPVTIPGREITVTLGLSNGEAIVAARETGLADALVTLHKSPGQHLADLRGNWRYMQLWRWLADATVYLTLFISVSGLYLWYVLRSERTTGVVLLFLGASSFIALAYVLIYGN